MRDTVQKDPGKIGINNVLEKDVKSQEFLKKYRKG